MNPNITIPDRIAKLPKDERGYPVPFFVQWFDDFGNPTNWGVGVPDQRVADERKLYECRDKKLCWICGQPLTYWIAFIGGPMSCKNRTFSDGPMHVECAEFSAVACPHLAHPGAKRRAGGGKELAYKPEGLVETPIEKVAVYVTRGYDTMRVTRGFLWRPFAPKEVRWFRAGQRLPE